MSSWVDSVSLQPKAIKLDNLSAVSTQPLPHPTCSEMSALCVSRGKENVRISLLFRADFNHY